MLSFVVLVSLSSGLRVGWAGPAPVNSVPERAFASRADLPESARHDLWEAPDLQFHRIPYLWEAKHGDGSGQPHE